MNTRAFFAILRAGLWEQDVHLLSSGDLNYEDICKLAEEQSVTGLVTAGLEHVQDVMFPQIVLLQLIGQSLQMESLNMAMNEFISWLITRLRDEKIYALLIKGQGIAQCYEKPLWRTNGDVDLLLHDEDYEQAKTILSKEATSIEHEDTYKKHISMQIKGFVVELHGSLHVEISKRIDRGLDTIQKDIFNNGLARAWRNNKTYIFLPDVNSDVVFVFCHILQHFFKGGVGLRQICDWCRLLWTYHDKIDVKLLEKRLRHMRIVSEWKVFAALAVDTIGMPTNAMPLYSVSSIYKWKARMTLRWILISGNMGHNIDQSYRSESICFVQKMITLGRRMKEYAYFATIFPLDAPRFFFSYLSHKL